METHLGEGGVVDLVSVGEERRDGGHVERRSHVVHLGVVERAVERAHAVRSLRARRDDGSRRQLTATPRTPIGGSNRPRDGGPPINGIG